jgi:hypothetical protein
VAGSGRGNGRGTNNPRNSNATHVCSQVCPSGKCIERMGLNLSKAMLMSSILGRRDRNRTEQAPVVKSANPRLSHFTPLLHLPTHIT